MTVDDRSTWSPMERMVAVTEGRCPGTRHDFEKGEEKIGFELFGKFIGHSKSFWVCKRCGQKAESS